MTLFHLGAHLHKTLDVVMDGLVLMHLLKLWLDFFVDLKVSEVEIRIVLDIVLAVAHRLAVFEDLLLFLP